jgi:ATP-binding cassette subfamily C protein
MALKLILRSFRLLSSREKAAIVAFSGARILANGLDVVGLTIIGLLGAVAIGSDIEIPILDLNSIELEVLLVILLVTAGGVFFLKTAIGILLARTSLFYLARVEAKLSMEIAQSLFEGDLSDFQKMSRPEIEWAILRSTSIAIGSIIGQTMALISDFSLALFVITLLVLTDWLSAAVMTAYLFLILATFQYFSRKLIVDSGLALSKGSIDVHEDISNLTNAFREIKVWSRTHFFLRKLQRSRESVSRAGAIMGYISSVPRLIVELGLVLGALGFVGFQFLINDGSINIAVFGVFLLGSARLLSALMPMQRAFMSLKFEAPSAKSAHDLLWALKDPNRIKGNRIEELDNHESNHRQFSFPEGMSVQLQGVNFSYDKSLGAPLVVKDISLSIAAGSLVAFIGPSGAGKSTLADLILGLNVPTSGEILCGGYSPRSIRNGSAGAIGYVPQKPGMVSGTISENIAFGIPPEEVDETLLEYAANSAGLMTLISSLPEGFSSDLGKHKDALSGGQIQRLGLARALYTKPSLIVLDEATSALDAETEAAISQNLVGLKTQATVIVIAHRLSTIQNADVIYVIDGGAVVASGTFREIRASSQLVRRYVELMSFED